MALRSNKFTPKFRWNPDLSKGVGGYIDAKGQAVANTKVREAIDGYLDAKSKTIRELSEQLQQRKIDTKAWQLAMEEHIADIHVANMAAAKGGKDRMTKADFLTAARAVKAELAGSREWSDEEDPKKVRAAGGLRKFVEQIDAGLPLDGRFLNRATQYAQAGRHTYESTRLDDMKDAGMAQAKSVRHASDSCAGCLAQAEKGWMLITELILPGERDCKRNCKCTVEYRAADEDKAVSVDSDMAGVEIMPNDMPLKVVNHLAPPQPHDYFADGVPISKALELPEELEPVRYALDAMDTVHGDGNLDALAAKQMHGKLSARRAIVGEYLGGEEPELGVHPKGPTPGLTLLHETGHWLDDRIFGKSEAVPGRYGMGNLAASGELKDLNKAINRSEATKKLKRLQDRSRVRGTGIGKNRNVDYDVNKKHVEYLLSPSEQFARAYSQYVATRSGNTQLRRELAARLYARRATTLGGATRDSLIYPEQWDAEDFEKIAQEFDKLFLSKGWLK